MNSHPSAADIRALTDDEIDQVTAATFELTLGPLTLQVNADSGCFAVWWGKDYVTGGCKK